MRRNSGLDGLRVRQFDIQDEISEISLSPPTFDAYQGVIFTSYGICGLFVVR